MSKLERKSSPGSELSELRGHILELFCTSLSDYNIQGKQKKLLLLHRGSLYLELRQKEPGWPLVDQHRLQQALGMGHNHVRLLLTLMDTLLEEICCCRQDLRAFLLQSEQSPVDTDQLNITLRLLHKHLKDFDTRDSHNLGSLDLQKQLIPSVGELPVPQVSASLCYKLPVQFDRLKSHAKSTEVHLVWSIADGQCQEPNQFYEIQTKILHPSEGEQGQYKQYAVLGQAFTLKNLTPDCFYQFSVKRVDSYSLVYGVWMDTLILKTNSMS